jgi:hypothetical protein
MVVIPKRISTKGWGIPFDPLSVATFGYYSGTESLAAVEYSREFTNSLPIDNTTLDTLYSDAEVIEVGIDNDSYVSIGANDFRGVYKLHQFKYQHTNNVDSISLVIQAKTDLAPTISTVYFQIFNVSTEEWETLDSNGVSDVSIEFVLAGGKFDNVEDYYDDENWVSVRIYQGGV